MTCVNLMHERPVAGHTGCMIFDTDGRADQGKAPGSHTPGERPVGGHEHLHGRPVSWVLVGVPAQQEDQGGTVAADTGSAADPGVDVGPRPAAAPGVRQPAVGR